MTKYIGDLDSDDYDTEKVLVTIPSDASTGTYDLVITLDYKDAFGEDHSKDYALALGVSSIVSYSAEKSGFGIGTLIFLLFLVGIGYFAYNKYLRK